MNTKHRTQKRPVSKDWPHHHILYHLHENGTNYSRLSRLNGYCSGAAVMVNHTASWPKMEELIAKAIGVTPQEIWPSRYNEDGTPKRGLRGKDQTNRLARNKNMAQPRPADNVEDRKAD